MFRSQTLASFEPVDKQKEAAEAQVYEVFDQTVGLDSFQVRELPVENTRAGLYIYLNAAVSAGLIEPQTRPRSHAHIRRQLAGRPLIDDTALFTYLHNRYQVSSACYVDMASRQPVLIGGRATCKPL